MPSMGHAMGIGINTFCLILSRSQKILRSNLPVYSVGASFQAVTWYGGQGLWGTRCITLSRFASSIWNGHPLSRAKILYVCIEEMDKVLIVGVHLFWAQIWSYTMNRTMWEHKNNSWACYLTMPGLLLAHVQTTSWNACFPTSGCKC